MTTYQTHETAPDFCWRCLRPSKYVWMRVLTLCGSGPDLSEAYLHRKGCQFTRNDSFIYIQMSERSPAAFWCYLH